jgi:hypothetical protein
MAKSTCPVVENGVVCGKPVYGLGYCNKHWQRVRNHGDPLTVLARRNSHFDFNAEAIDYFLLFAMTPTDGCRRWPFNFQHGYGRLGYKSEHLYVHVLICEAWHGPKPEGFEAAHSCGNQWCWAGEHLRWATHIENERDKIEHGTIPRGTRQGGSKLTETDVLEIRRRLAAGEHEKIIAADYGVHRTNVHAIALRKSWAWLE